MKKIRDFFWLCSGANKRILLECPTESSKYAGIGATVLFTGIFAALAGFYASYTVFENIWSSAAIGLVWGATIFNLDRYIVSSMRKMNTPTREWKMAAPRIILAIMIAVVISKPLEMRIFDKEIQAEIHLMEQEYTIHKDNLINSRFTPSIDSLRSQNEDLKKEIADKTIKRDELMEIARQEADGTGGTMKRNAGPIYAIKKADADKIDQELQELVTNNSQLIRDNLSRIQEIEAEQSNEIASQKDFSLNGLASRMEALNRLTTSSSAIWIANWFIILLFIAIETAPVFVKLISSRGPYDYMLEGIEYDFKANSVVALARSNTRVKKQAVKMPQIEKSFVTDRLDLEINRI